ncbi:pLS20_p028 family conjugation system transmembrane protein [Macrococcoides caseolyticum]|uniref:PLS20_p028 family conjugation system transmembrane protein n=1 Tax=Macrococcus psychrotolerans TaxID=3039389 RepID=A0AAT9P8W8_9STAP|nr:MULTISPECIES: hypothetical protein [Macrococcus]PKD97954.1 hypothetical protein CW719_09735 [Macrococcus caseolyticus]PKF18409.1 hypothetical protein CW717_09735 [Macrococcus caseolyticus]QYA34170.1 hypothetical protein KYI10_12095 [Macrococcus sp. 19Msa1099]QYA38971.1 hypothetical protein KYI07_12075 [Macrococcus caseolyticus]QYA77681.1 hypothetical protein KYI12_12080 [Macrococcus caseolyticus]
MGYEEILETYKELFVQQDWVWMILFKVLWGMVLFCHATIAILEKGLDKMLTFNGFFESEAMNGVNDVVMPIAIALFTMSLIWIGYLIMSGRGIKKGDVFMNVLLAFGLILGIPYLTTELNNISTELVQAGKDAGSGETLKSETFATQIVAMNTVDLLYLSREMDWELDKKTYINNDISSSNIKYKDFSGLVNPSNKDGIKEAGDRDYNLDSKEKKVFGHKLIDSEDGNISFEKIEPAEFKFIGQVGFLNKWYYRYNANFFTMFIQFGVLGFVLIFAMFKTMLLMMEIAFQKLIAPWIAATDITTGQKMKTFMNDFVMNYAAIGILAFVMKLYLLAMQYITTLGWNPWIISVAMIALGKFVIDGPETAKRLLGIDVGVQDGYKALMGSLAAGGAMIGAGKMLGKGVSSAKDGVNNLREKQADPNHKGLAERFGGKTADAIKGMTREAGELSSAGVGGYVSNKSNEAMRKMKDGITGTAEAVKSGISDNGLTESFAEGKANAQAYADSTSTSQAIPSAMQKAVSEVVDNNSGLLTTGERNVLEKVIRGDSGLSDEERNVVERLSNSGSLSENDRDILRNVLTHTSNAGQLEDQTAVQRYLTESGNNINSEDKTALERLIRDPSNVSAEDRLAIERVLSNGNSNLKAEDRLAIERLLQTGNNGVTASDRTAIENVLSNDNQLSTNDRQVMERVLSNPSEVTSQDRQAFERVISQNMSNLNQEQKTAFQNIQQQMNGTIAPDLRPAIQSYVQNQGSSMSKGDRQVMERVISSPTQATSQDRQAFERIISQNTGSMNQEQRTAFQNVHQQMNGTIAPDVKPAIQSFIQNQGLSMSNGDRQVMERVISNPSQATSQDKQVFERVVSQNTGNMNQEQRTAFQQVNQQLGSTVSSDVKPIMQSFVRSQGSNMNTEERQIMEKVISSPLKVTNQERAVFEKVIQQNTGTFTQEQRTAFQHVNQQLEKVTVQKQDTNTLFKGIDKE